MLPSAMDGTAAYEAPHAINSISTSASLGSAATCTVDRAGGTVSRARKILCVNLIHGRKVRHRLQKYSALHHVRQVQTRMCQHCLQVFQHLRCLLDNGAWHKAPRFWIDGNLPRRKQQVADPDRLRVRPDRRRCIQGRYRCLRLTHHFILPASRPSDKMRFGGRPSGPANQYSDGVLHWQAGRPPPPVFAQSIQSIPLRSGPPFCALLAAMLY